MLSLLEEALVNKSKVFRVEEYGTLENDKHMKDKPPGLFLHPVDVGGYDATGQVELHIRDDGTIWLTFNRVIDEKGWHLGTRFKLVPTEVMEVP